MNTERNIPIEKLGVNSVEYQTYIENLKNRQLPHFESLVFGQKTNIDQSKSILISKQKNEKLAPLVAMLFSEAFENQEIAQEIKESLQIESLPAPEKLPNITTQISTELLEKILKLHKQKFQEKLNIFFRELPKIEEKFLSKLKQAQEKGIIPLTNEEIRSRLAHTTVYMEDAIYALGKNNFGYSTMDNEVVIYSHTTMDEILHTYTHELIHLLAGKAIVSVNKKIYPEKHGLNIRLPLGLSKKKVKRFEWLNEAVTETIGMQVLGITEGSRKKNRQLLDLIIKNSQPPLSTQLFTNAYFENFDPDNFNSVPNWKKLTLAIRNAYGEKFFTKIDQLSREKEGLEKAIKIMEKYGSEPHKINSELDKILFPNSNQT